MAHPHGRFEPRAILAALERSNVDYILIGGLAQVIRGADLTTRGVDICPSFGAGNLERLRRAASDLDAERSDSRVLDLTDSALGAEQQIPLSTAAGALTITGAPAGAPKGFVDLRRTASKEHLGHGIQPLVASTGDLARMAAALHRQQDLERLPQLRHIIELEATRSHITPPAPPARKPSRTATPNPRQAQR